jgi:hypothetical protein
MPWKPIDNHILVVLADGARDRTSWQVARINLANGQWTGSHIGFPDRASAMRDAAKWRRYLRTLERKRLAKRYPVPCG